jgi:hypothetical protein
MSKRSEEAALRLYPESSGPMERSIFEDRRVTLACRRACENGYKQAEKDLALTWEDIETIDDIIEQLSNHSALSLQGQEVFYQEVLRIFREMKNK